MLETLFETWFNNSHLAVAILDKEFNFVRVNETYARADNRTPEEFPGKNHFDMYPSSAINVFREVVATKKPYQTFARPFEYAHAPERGTTHWDWTLAPILNTNGEVELLVFTLIDVTERVRSEEAAMESMEQLSSILKHITSGFFLLDRAFKFAYVNDAALPITPAQRSFELIGKSLWDVFPHLMHTEAGQLLLHAMKERKAAQFEHKTIKGAWFEAFVHPTPSGLSIFFNDITVRKATEEALIASEDKFSTLFRLGSAPTSIRTVEDGRYLDVNEAWLEMCGFSLDEVMGKSAKDLNLHVDRDTYEMPQRVVKEGKVIRNRPFRYRNKSGEVREAVSYSDLITVNGQTCILTTTLDVTEQKAFEQELSRLERLNLIGQMANGIGHEIRNPLTSVRGFLQLLSKRHTDSKPQYDLMIEEVDRANAIITNFLELAKTKAEALALLDINDILLQVFPMLRAQAIANDRDITLSLGSTKKTLLSEREIKQVLLNLTNNALDATPPGTSVHIETTVSGNDLLLLVRDKGPGIAPDLLPKLGTPFLTTKDNGTGLGLAITYNIVKLHEGRVEVESSPSGTSFTARLPIRGQV